MEDRMNNPWRKSTYSGSGGGECVEVGAEASVLVRDSQNRGGETLAFTAGAWGAFVNSLK
jgi:hypothetical protein